MFYPHCQPASEEQKTNHRDQWRHKRPYKPLPPRLQRHPKDLLAGASHKELFAPATSRKQGSSEESSLQQGHGATGSGRAGDRQMISSVPPLLLTLGRMSAALGAPNARSPTTRAQPRAWPHGRVHVDGVIPERPLVIKPTGAETEARH